MKITGIAFFLLFLLLCITTLGQQQVITINNQPQIITTSNAFTDSVQLSIAAYKKATFERDPVTALSLYIQFLKDFPISRFEKNLDYGKIYEHIILTYNANQQPEKYVPYISTTPFGVLSNIYYKCVYVLYDRVKLLTAEQAYPYSDLILKRIVDFKYTPISDYSTKPADEWVKEFNRCYFGAALTHINILKTLNKNVEGLDLAEQAIHYFGYEKATLNEDYAILLERTGKLIQLQQVLELSMKNNQSTNIMIDMLKKSYIVKNKNDNGFDQYMEGLKDQKGKTKLQDKIKTSMIKTELPPFKMYDAKGELVKSGDQKGKIIVLDFWASWCAPCKASFAGMKLAVEKYKNDPNVVFYFIDTQEHAVNYKEIAMRFIKEKQYDSFNVLFDNTIKGSKTNDEVAKLYKVGPIPQKLIIDTKGYLRFVSVGYNGSPSELSDEISTMIDLVKTEK